MTFLNFETLNVGDSLPELKTAPISRTTLALFAGASGDHNPIHIDIDFAKKAGMDDVFAHGMLSMAYLGRLLTGWTPQKDIRTFNVRFTSITNLRDEITCSGKVIEKNDDDRTVTVEVAAANQQGDIKLAGEAVVSVS